MENMHSASLEKHVQEKYERNYPQGFENLRPEVRAILERKWNHEERKLKTLENMLAKGDANPYTKREKVLTEQFFARVKEAVDAEQSPEVKELTIPDVADVRIIYDDHKNLHHPRVYEGLDACIKELRSGDDADFLKKFPDALVRPKETSYGENATMNAVAIADEMPIIYADVQGANARRSQELRISNALRTLEAIGIAGIGGGASVAMGKYYAKKRLEESRNADKKQFSRRDFLKAGIAFAGAGAVAVAAKRTPFSRLLSEEKHVDEQSLVRQVDKEMTLAEEAMGFQQFLAVFRNAVMAQKLCDAAKDFRKNSEEDGDMSLPKIGIEIGTNHSSIEMFLQMQERDRLKVIMKIAEALYRDGETFDAASVVHLQYEQNADTQRSWRVTKSENRKIADVLQRVQAHVQTQESGEK